MVKEKKALNSKMREILRVLHKGGGAMSENEIAKETGLSYVTVKKYLKKLHELNLIEETK
jgi:uncharacterized membrane protein